MPERDEVVARLSEQGVQSLRAEKAALQERIDALAEMIEEAEEEHTMLSTRLEMLEDAISIAAAKASQD